MKTDDMGNPQLARFLNESPNKIWEHEIETSTNSDLVEAFYIQVRQTFNTLCSAQLTPRATRLEKRNFIKEWKYNHVSKKRNELRMNILDLNRFPFLWIRVSIPNAFLEKIFLKKSRFFLQSKEHHTGIFDSCKVLITKANLDVVPHWRQCGWRESPRLRLMLTPPIPVPCLSTIKCKCRNLFWRTMSDRKHVYHSSKPKIKKQRDELDFRMIKVNRVTCYFRDKKWQAISMRRGQDVSVKGDAIVTILVAETSRFESLMKEIPSFISKDLWTLVCEYEMTIITN